jgi:hypothetical protein
LGRLWAGAAVLFAAAAGALATGGWHALTSASDLVWHSAAWLLLALAVLNLLRAVVPSGALAGPAIFAAGSLGVLIAQGRLSVRLSAPALVAAALALAACAIFVGSPTSPSGATAVGWVIHRRVQGSIAPTLTVVAILGVVGLDLRTAVAPDGNTTLRCLILGGRIELRVPKQAEVELSLDSSAPLVRISDDGTEPVTNGMLLVRIRLLGAVGGFALRRD